MSCQHLKFVCAVLCCAQVVDLLAPYQRGGKIGLFGGAGGLEPSRYVKRLICCLTQTTLES